MTPYQRLHVVNKFVFLWRGAHWPLHVIPEPVPHHISRFSHFIALPEHWVDVSLARWISPIFNTFYADLEGRKGTEEILDLDIVPVLAVELGFFWILADS